MINTILEVLVAVVVLIVIIAVLALRYLRADDSDTFDDIPDEPRRRRREPESRRDLALPAAAERRARPAAAAAQATRQLDARGPSGYRDRDTGPRPASIERASGPHTGPGRREPVGARPGRPARPVDADSLTNSWESLSDVDYWAELAADKSQDSPAAGPAPAARGRGVQAPSGDARQQPAVTRPATRADHGRLPVRQRNQAARTAGAPARPVDLGQTEQIDMRAAQSTGRYPHESATAALEALGRRGTGPQRSAPGPREAAGQRSASALRPAQPRPPVPGPPAAVPSAPVRAPGRADDDPLTSPSFPAITTADSRSYRTRRHAGGQPAGAPQPNGRSSGQKNHGATGQQSGSYPSPPERATSRPDGYPVQATPLPPAAQAPQQPAAAPVSRRQTTSVQPATPAANPYGSYVSAPQPSYTEPTYQPASPAPSAPGAHAAAYGLYPTGPQAVGNGWHGAPTGNGSTSAGLPPLGHAADGYLPAAGLPGNGAGTGSHLSHLGTGNGNGSNGSNGNGSNGNGTGAYAGIDYGSIRYDTPMYGDDHQALPGYGAQGQPAGHYDQHGYAGQDAAYGQDGQPGYPRHGARGR